MRRAGGRQNKRHKRFGRYVLLVAIAVLVALLLMQTSPRLRQALDPARTTISDHLSGISQTGFLPGLTGGSRRDRQIAGLEARIRELAPYKTQVLVLSEQLEVYRNMLNVQGEAQEGETTTRVMAETNGPFAEVLLAGAGREHGIRKGYFAENNHGLVGRVIQVGQQSSRILKVTDFNCRVPVMGETSGLRAIMFGGRDKFGQLGDLPEQGVFLPNERILTSGEGGLYQRGVLVGWVMPDNGQTVRVDLAMRRGQLSHVRLKPPPTVAKPEDIPATDLSTPTGRQP